MVETRLNKMPSSSNNNSTKSFDFLAAEKVIQGRSDKNRQIYYEDVVYRSSKNMLDQISEGGGGGVRLKEEERVNGLYDYIVTKTKESSRARNKENINNVKLGLKKRKKISTTNSEHAIIRWDENEDVQVEGNHHRRKIDKTSSSNAVKKVEPLREFFALYRMSQDSSSRLCATTPVRPGVRVVRGPDWKANNDDVDGGEGHLGTVVQIQGVGPADVMTPCENFELPSDRTVTVIWDCGAEGWYRIGLDECYDLRVWDNGPIGVRHVEIRCDGCGVENFFGIRWCCVECPGSNLKNPGENGALPDLNRIALASRLQSPHPRTFDLCNECYMKDKHDLSHKFQRIDSPRFSGIVLVSPRSKSRKVKLSGILPGAVVRRGPHWRFQDQDGGSGNAGQVKFIADWKNDSGRSVAEVTWLCNDETQMYRLGHKGKVDVVYFPNHEGSDGHYYPDHLPAMGRYEHFLNSNASMNDEGEMGDKESYNVTVGDMIRIMKLDEFAFRKHQNGHGGFHESMLHLIGLVGKVHRITDNADLRIQYGEDKDPDQRWTINPRIVQKIETEPKNTPTVIPEVIDKARETKEYLKFIKMCALGRVEAVKKFLTFREKNFSNESKKTFKMLGRGLVVAAQEGKLETVEALLEVKPFLAANARFSSKTPLHIAIHEGHLDVADLLLFRGASVAAEDDEGDSAVFYAAYGNQPTALEFLIERGGDISARNGTSYTPLMVAVRAGNVECVRIILRKAAQNADINGQGGPDMNTALQEAVGLKDPAESKAIVKALLETVDIDTVNVYNNRNLNAFLTAVSSGNDCAASAILASNPRAFWTISQGEGLTCLHIAAEAGNYEMIKFILNHPEAEQMVLAKDTKNGRTPLHFACRKGRLNIVQMLMTFEIKSLNQNSDQRLAGILDNNGDSPLALTLARVGNPFENSEISLESRIPGDILKTLQYVDDDLKLWIATAIILIRDGGGDPMSANNKGFTAMCRLADPVARSVVTEAYLDTEKKKSASTLAAPDQQKRPLLLRKVSRVDCRICEDNVEPVRFKPCGHAVVCEECSVRMKKCVVCGVKIVAKVVCEAIPPTPTSADGSSAALALPGFMVKGGKDGNVKDLEEKVKKYEDNLLCAICMVNMRKTSFLCGHGGCTECVSTLENCHMCREPIEKVIYMF